MNNHNIELALYVKEGDKYTFQLLPDCLTDQKTAQSFAIEPEFSSIAIKKGNQQVLKYLMWGYLDILLKEITEVLNRITQSKTGVIRHASMEGDVGLYLLFIPRNQNVEIQIIEIDDTHDMHMCFPIPGISGDPAQIYSFVENWLGGNITDKEVKASNLMQSFEMPMEDLRTILKREYALGTELMKILNDKA